MPDPTVPPDGVPPRLSKPRLRAPGAGRPRKSARLHALQGTKSRAPTSGRNRAGAPASAAAAPADPPSPELLNPPAWLDVEGKLFWTTYAPTLITAGRLKQHHLATWTLACETWQRYRRATKALPKRISPKVFPPAYAIQRQALEKLIHLLGRFGMDPATDARLMMGGEDPLNSAPPLNSSGTAPATADRSADWMRVYGAAPGA